MRVHSSNCRSHVGAHLLADLVELGFDALLVFPHVQAAADSYTMAQEMHRLQAIVHEDYKAQRAYYRKFADAQAAMVRPVKERGPDKIIEITGNTTRVCYDQQNNPRFFK